MTRRAYPSALSDREWLLPPPKPGGRPLKYSRREEVNAIRYVLRTGCVWRMLPPICLHGGPRSTTSAPGDVMGPGSVFMGLCVTGCVSPKAGMCSAKHCATNPPPPSDPHPLPSLLRTRVLLWTHELCWTHRPGRCEPPRTARLPARKLPRSYGETVTFLLKMARSVYRPYSIRLNSETFPTRSQL